MSKSIKRKCSVITPVYNAERWLSATIQSCLDQAEYLREIILIDDFSTDSSWDILQQYQNEYPDLVRVFKNTDKGGNNARNLGFSLSCGDYIQWLDADDTIRGEKFKIQMNFLEAHTDIDIAYSGWQHATFIDGILINSLLYSTTQYPDYLYTLLNRNWLPPHAYLLRRGAALKTEKMNGWDPVTYVCQDWEYIAKAALSGAKFGYVPGIFCIYNSRLNESSVSRSVTNESRAKEIIRLLSSTYEEIQKQAWIEETKKNLYYKSLLTQILRNSLFYNLPVDIKDASVPKIEWDTIKGVNAKLKKLESILEAV
jgi:glycosyltransferase involved in cell wall biosynthesis